MDKDNGMSNWIRADQNGCIIEVHISPQSKKCEIVGLYNNRLKIKIDSPPVDGKANAALIRFLAETLGLKMSNLSILRGETSKIKQIKIIGLTKDFVEKELLKRATP